MLPVNLWITLLVAFWIYVLWSRRRLYKLMLQVPGPIGYPIIGSLYGIWRNKSIFHIADTFIKEYGYSWLVWFGTIPVYCVADPVIAQDLLTSPNAVNKNRIAYNVVEEIIGHGLVSLNEPEWSIHRKILNPAFGQKGLVNFIPIFNKEGSSLIRELNSIVGMEEKDLVSKFQNYTLRIATQTTMGTDVNNEEVFKNGTLVNKIQSSLDTGRMLVLKPWHNISFIRKMTGVEELLNDSKSTVSTVIRKMIHQTIQNDIKTGESEDKNHTFLNLAIAQLKSRVFDYQNIEDEANSIIFAASETTATIINYVLMLLAMFPEYQERVFEEIKLVFPNTGDFEVSFEDTQKLEYLEMVINETLRLMPAIPLILREVSEDLRLSNGVVLPKGLAFTISIFHTHRNKVVWGPEADKFNPDNCLPSNLQNKHPFALIPFLKGKRNCIGWKYGIILLKITLIKILRNFEVSTSDRLENIVFVDNVSLKLKDPPRLQLKSRS